MELALEALNQATGMCAERTSTRRDIDEAITALRQTLEQPEHEPVAWMQADQPELYVKECKDEMRGYTIPLYAAPPRREWVGLTDKEVSRIENKYTAYRQIPEGSVREFARAIEAKLKDKNRD